MKKLIITIIFLLSISYVFSQQSERNSASFSLGDGISFTFNEGKYKFDIFGFIRPSYIYSEDKIFNNDGSYSNVYRQFKTQNSNLYFTGEAIDEKLSFTIQMDYSSSDPLVEAFIGYHINEKTTLYFGQMQVYHNNLEMTQNEDQLRLASRGLISDTYTESGEEFGIFLETSFGNSFLVEPKFAITSGDGRNSFGVDSRDSDKGGVKFGSRVNIFPLGSFEDGNQDSTVDLTNEEKLKAQVGFAFSKNFGASNLVGDGHGDFILYDNLGNEQFPDYSQLFFDLNLKYKGFSLLFEYADSFASGLNGIYTDPNGFNLLQPEEISEYLILGDSRGIHFGYFTKNGYSLDVIYEQLNPEFVSGLNPIFRESNNFGIGLSKYLSDNNIKLQASLFKTEIKNNLNVNDDEYMSGSFIVTLVF
tara:strand:+ start:1767 stop:3017 length:1251 start_codon:yes stop_codon:yes gene_type:complete